MADRPYSGYAVTRMSNAELKLPTDGALEVTSERILDIAERLLADNGVSGTSIRMITDSAGVNVAAVNYHFGTKHELVQEVINRRAMALEALRTTALDALDERTARENRKATIEEIAEALIAPIMTQALADGSGWPHFMRFVSRLAWEPGGDKFEAPESSVRMLQRIDKTLREALPHLADNPAKRVSRAMFMRGATQHTLMVLTATRTNALPKDKLIAAMLASTADVEAVKRELITFVAAGLSAP